MPNSDPVFRTPERNAFCRVCSCVIERNKDYMVSWWSSHNRGMYVHICPSCVVGLYELLPQPMEGVLR